MATIKASCHCGATKFEAPAPTEVTACTCSYCDRVGALWAYCSPDDLKITAGEGTDAEYRFNSKMVEHRHCPICGCATYGKSPDFTTGTPNFEKPRVGWNVRMAFDFDRSKIPVLHVDGRNDW